MNSVAAVTEQAAGNVNMIASAVKEMMATIRASAKNSGNARNIINKAVEQADTTSEKINDLGNAANEIRNKIEEIQDFISSAIYEMHNIFQK